MLYRGRWADEDVAGLVQSVRYVPSRTAHVVDVQEMRRLNQELFAVKRGKRKENKWFDIAEVRVVQDAVYVPTQDAYRVDGARDGYAYVPRMDDEARQEANEEYRQLKTSMLRTTTLVGLAGTFAGAIISPSAVALPFAYGSLASLFYLTLLQRGVDSVGAPPSFPARLLGLRFAVPILPFLALSITRGNSPFQWFGSVSKSDALSVVLGLLTYKVPIFIRTAGEFVDGLAEIELGKTGMVGTVAMMTAKQIKSRRDAPIEEQAPPSETASPVFIFAGPSGVGKNTLIRLLMEKDGSQFDYSVSHTTREIRAGEEDGRDYNFVSTDEFERMITEGQFIEYAKVHGNYYGTSFQAVNAVRKEGKVCILDLDVQGVDTVRSKQQLPWQPRFIWIAPPSIDDLKQRLKARGTETDETIQTRLNTAMREISYAATNNVFDITIINDNLDAAYKELEGFIDDELLLFQ